MPINGLRNIGNTCFLNTAIQCLLAISRFRILLTFLNIPEMGFFQQIFESKTSTILSPLEIYDLYLKLSRTERYKQGDTVECFLQFLQHFDQNCTQINSTNNLINLECCCYSFWCNETKNSIVHDCFSGVIYHNRMCLSCGYNKQHFELFRILPMYCSSVKQCLLEHSDKLTAHCEQCGNNTMFKTHKIFHRFPPILIFELLNDNNSYEMCINIHHCHKNKQKKYEYKMKAIVLYEHNHYKCIVFDENCNDYVLIDDDKVQPINDNTNINYSTSRLLIYERN